jgi:uroporphyrinogen III methyltransferase/synthase
VYRGEALAEKIIAAHGGPMHGVRVLFPRAAVARDALPDLLRAAGADVDIVPVYRTVGPSEETLDLLRTQLERRELDVVTFTSGSTVDHMVEALGQDARAMLRGVILACIGPVTRESAEKHGLHIDVSAARYTIDGLVEALHQHFAASP